MVLPVLVKPRASREEVWGEREGALVVRLTAPPVEGEANAALCRLLGRVLGVAPSAVRILQGRSARRKRVLVAGLALAEVRARLEGPEGVRS